MPVVLLGHSMGGRTAVAVADDPSVVGVVALAPWLPAGRAERRPGRQAVRGGARAQRQDHLVPADPGLLRAAPRAWPRRWSSTTWAGSGTTCSAASRPGTRFAVEPLAGPARRPPTPGLSRVYPDFICVQHACRSIVLDETKPFRFIHVNGRPTMTHRRAAPAPPPRRGRARGGDPRRHARPARPGRLRPADHGRRRRPRRRRARPRSTGAGPSKPSLVVDAHPAHQGGAPGPRGRHRQPARRPGADGLRARRPRPTRGRPQIMAGARHRPAPRPRLRRGVPHPRPRPQDRDRAARIFERARARGEITADLDLDLLSPALAGIILHRSFVLGLPADEKTVAQVVDEIILPAATRRSV